FDAKLVLQPKSVPDAKSPQGTYCRPDNSTTQAHKYNMETTICVRPPQIDRHTHTHTHTHSLIHTHTTTYTRTHLLYITIPFITTRVCVCMCVFSTYRLCLWASVSAVVCNKSGVLQRCLERVHFI